MTEEHRTKIANTQILNRLLAHHMGEIELSKTQIDVGLALLKKVLPDLQAVTLSGDENSPIHLRQRIERVIVDAGR